LSEKGVRLAQKMQVGRALLWEYGYTRLKLAQLLGQLDVFLTLPPSMSPPMRAETTAGQLSTADLGETGPLSQGVQVGRKALRIHHIHGMKVRKKRPRGFK
jgi:hypothetical protein